MEIITKQLNLQQLKANIIITEVQEIVILQHIQEPLITLITQEVLIIGVPEMEHPEITHTILPDPAEVVILQVLLEKHIIPEVLTEKLQKVTIQVVQKTEAQAIITVVPVLHQELILHLIIVDQDHHLVIPVQVADQAEAVVEVAEVADQVVVEAADQAEEDNKLYINT